MLNDMNIDFYRVHSREMLEEAFALVKEEYKKEKYIDAGAEPEIPSYNFLPTSATFVAKMDDAVVGMITLVEDGDEGLPMESIYGEEIGRLRNRKKKMAEISQLAISRGEETMDDGHYRKFRSKILLALFRLVYFFSKCEGIECLCITINPKHESFYESIGFESIGGLKTYPRVNNAPALAKMLNMRNVSLQQKDVGFVFQEILKNPLSREDFSRSGPQKAIFSLES